jgi:microsomal dipeptidase-like Zn-dependent dipeptidase
MRRFLRVGVVVLVLLVIAFFFFFAPGAMEDRYNSTRNQPPYQAADEARPWPGRMVIADLHADSLLWGRDLRKRSARGHVDIPRLLAGGVAVQGFGVVTRVPRGQNIRSNEDSTDALVPLLVAQAWPPRTWNSLTERALYQAERLHAMAADSGGTFTIVRTRRDLDVFLSSWRNGERKVAGFLGIEGAQALDGKLENLERLHAAGFRMLGLAHFYDNAFAGSAHGVQKHGLTDAGRELVRRIEHLGIAVDLAHASPQAVQDILAMVTKPVVVSHTGVRGTCDNQRNLSDDQLRRIAATGGVVGIGYWETAVCGKDARAIARAIRHAADVMGVAHVGLGSDFDGAVETPFDTTGLALLIAALREEGFAEGEIAAIMGGNVVRVLGQTLPQ